MLNRQLKLTLVMVLLLMFTLTAIGSATAAVNDAVINEFSASHDGADDYEYVEIFGDVSTDHSALTILVVEGDSTGAGEIDGAWPVGSTDANGFWHTGFLSGDLENGSITLMLVSGFEGEVEDDLDADNDGVIDLDPLPWSEVIDDVAVDDGGANDRHYSDTILSGNYDGLSSFAPGGASRYPDGMDTDTVDDWYRNDFDLAGIPGFDGTPVFGEAYNTPGAPNELVPEPEEVCGDPFTPIPEIQGTGDSTPIYGYELSTEGVVVGENQGSSGLNGFFIQDPEGDADPMTSDGIFVYAPGSDPVEEGDAVRVHGFAGEYSGQTQVTGVSLILDCTDDATPAISPTEVNLPVTEVDDWEMYEGMLVYIPEELFVTEVYNLVRFGEAMLASDGINISPTNAAFPGAPALAVEEANAKKSIILDDGSSWQYLQPTPYVGPENTLRIGDTTDGITAVAGDGFGNYRLQPTNSYAIDFDYVARPTEPADVGGTIQVATYNVLNFWTTWCEYPLCRGAATEEVFEIQSEKLAKSIVALDADVIGVQELENFFDDEDPSNDDEALMALVDVLNDYLGEAVWSFVPTPTNPRVYDNNNAIINGIIYRNDRVEAVEGMSWWLDDPSFNELREGVSIGRAPIAQTFDAQGEIFTVVSNHFKSKSTSLCPDNLSDPDADQGDGQGCFNHLRTLEALAVGEFVDLLKSESGDDDVIVLGDFNSYTKEDPAQALGASLVNQLDEFLAEDEQVTYVFQGGNGALDYIFTTDEMMEIPTNPGVARIQGLDIFHINHEEPAGFVYYDHPDYIKANPEDPWPMYRASDHDPIKLGFCDAVPPVVTVQADPSWIWPPNHRYHEIQVTVSASDNFDENPSIWHEEEGWFMSNEPDNGLGDGNTTDDILLESESEGGSVFKVRAERSGNGVGRTYTFTYKATDSCGNVGEGSAIVFVPHDMGDKDDLADRSVHMNIPRP